MNYIPPILEKERAWLYMRLIANGMLQGFAVVAILFLVRSVFDSMAPRHGPIHLMHIFWLGLILAAVGIIRGMLAWLEGGCKPVRTAARSGR